MPWREPPRPWGCSDEEEEAEAGEADEADGLSRLLSQGEQILDTRRSMQQVDVSVAVAVEVESTSSAMGQFNLLLGCLYGDAADGCDDVSISVGYGQG